MIRIDPITATVRFYDHKIDKECPLSEMKGESYYKTLTLLIADNGHVRIMASESAPTIREQRQLTIALTRLGYKQASWCHNGKEQLINVKNKPCLQENS